MNKAEEIKREIGLLKKLIKDTYKKIEVLSKQRNIILIENKEYITDLSEYISKNIVEITAISSTGDEVWLPREYGLDVDYGGTIDSYDEGQYVNWSDEHNCYMLNSETKLDILGFIDIKVMEESDE